MSRIFYVIIWTFLAISQPANAVSLAKPEEGGARASKKEWSLPEKNGRKPSLRETRKMIRSSLKELKKKYDEEDDRTVLLAVISIFLPFVAVYLKEGEITEHFWISILLSLLFWVPGVVYALLIVFDIL